MRALPLPHGMVPLMVLLMAPSTAAVANGRSDRSDAGIESAIPERCERFPIQYPRPRYTGGSASQVTVEHTDIHVLACARAYASVCACAGTSSVSVMGDLA